MTYMSFHNTSLFNENELAVMYNLKQELQTILSYRTKYGRQGVYHRNTNLFTSPFTSSSYTAGSEPSHLKYIEPYVP